MYTSLKLGDVVQSGDEFKSTSGKWEVTPIDGNTIIDNGVEWRRPVLCGCQEGMVGTENCPLHGTMPFPIHPLQGGCWFCQRVNPECNAFSSEFDTSFHIKCLIDAMKRERHQETRIMFDETFMSDGDELLAIGALTHGRCFLLDDDGQWYEMSELECRRVGENELICREKGPSKFDNPRKAYLKDGGKDADSFKLNPPRGNA